MYAAIDRVAALVAAEPKRPKGEEPLTAEQQQALDDAMAEHRLALEQARAVQGTALNALYRDDYWNAGWVAKVQLEKIARERIKASSSSAR